MALRRYTRSVDGTIPVSALLYNDEELLASEENVGIYDDVQKVPNYQNGTAHVSTHRLFYIDSQRELSCSFALDLSYVSQTDHYAGLFKSSPKVTLHLSAESFPSSGLADVDDPFESWECEVCSYRNPPGMSPSAAKICGLCGVPRSAVPNTVEAKVTSPPRHHSTSLPSTSYPSAFSSSTNLSRSVPSHTPPPPSPSSDGALSCPACTFLNHPSLPACEMCGTQLPRPRARPSMKSAPTSRPASPDVSDDEDESRAMSIKLSFRKGGDKAFYGVLKRSLKTKAWKADGVSKRVTYPETSFDTDSGDTESATAVGRSGIHGILHGVKTSAISQETDMRDALQDLEALMVKAKDMVRLAAELNERLTTSSTTTSSATSDFSSAATLVPFYEPEEATFIRSSLSQLGLQISNAPVTLDMIRDERKWVSELARELANVLQGAGEKGGMMKERSIIALDEVWGGWNRARGVALIPPSTFLLVLPHLPSHTSPPIRMRTFPSGLSVLHTPPYTHVSFTARLVHLLALSGPMTTMDIALDEDITLALATEMISAVENEGNICRDDGMAVVRNGGSGGAVEVKWWPNMFKDYEWDGYTHV